MKVIKSKKVMAKTSGKLKSFDPMSIVVLAPKKINSYCRSAAYRKLKSINMNGTDSEVY